MEDIEQSKSEDATPYKLEQAKKKGTTARGLDLGVVVGLMALTGYLWAFGDGFAVRIARTSQHAFAAASQIGGSQQALSAWTAHLIADTASALAPLFAIIVIAALASSLLQTGFIFAPSMLKLDFTKLNPANGLKRVFSVHTVIETIKAVLKFVVYSSLATYVVLEAATVVVHLGTDIGGVAHALKRTSLSLLAWFALSGAIFAAADQLIVRRQFAKKMKMSRRELRDEIRNREGDPRIRQRRRQLAAELRQRSLSMRGVRGADLMVTNPTHVAIALRYDPHTMSAPTIVSRGAGDFATRLKRLAFIYRVPIVEDRELARELYRRGALEAEIPPHTFNRTADLYRRHQDVRRQGAPRGEATA